MRQLLREAVPVHLSPKAFDLLALLVQGRTAAISKADIHQRLWPHTFVSDVSLAVLVTEIREALGDNARRPEYVRTVNQFGYAFLAPVFEIDRHLVLPDGGPPCWLAWGTERAVLRRGENVIGRDPTSDICIDAIGVSRRHAIIFVADSDVTLRDLASKNGTFANEARVTSPVSLHDRAQIRLGPLSVQFRRSREIPPTQTMDVIPNQKDSR